MDPNPYNKDQAPENGSDEDNNTEDQNISAPEQHAQEDAMKDIAYEMAQEEDPLAPTSEGDSVAEQKVLALQEQLDEAKDQMMRAVAEAENTRRRMMKEREDGRKYAVSGFAKDLLDFSDNFRRALDSIPEDAKLENDLISNVLNGIEAMEKELLRTFEKHGIEKIEPIDEVFDPNKHEVMFEAPMPDKAAGTIIQVIEPGYLLHDRLLRPARVGVAKDDGQGGSKSGESNHIDTQV